MPRGRPANIDRQLIIECVLKHKNEIIVNRKHNSIVTKTHPVWKTLSTELLGRIAARTLYSYVANDTFSLKKLLFGTDYVARELLNTSSESEQSTSANELDLRSIITFSESEFNELISQTLRQTADKKRKRIFRVVNILKPHIWTEIVSKKIYDEHRLLHGYHFKSRYVNRNKKSYGFEGHCKCGSKVSCELLPRTGNEKFIKFSCIASAGNGECGKGQSRVEYRERVASTLENESTELYRVENAAILKYEYESDSTEPPHLHSADVSRTIEYQSQQPKYKDLQPIHAIAELKKSEKGQNVVRDIGFDPMIVHFWSPNQIRVFNKLSKANNSFLCIGATEGIEKPQHLFLYLAVLSSPTAQSAAFGMISERQDTVSIVTWLMRWIQSGAEYPKEVVCDSSKALLNACCLVFTGYETSESYANACMTSVLPRTKIGIDVADYVNNWAKYLAMENKGVNKFFMSCIAQLIICRSQTEATKIIESLLLISTSKTAGNGASSLIAALQYMNKMSKEFAADIEEVLNLSLQRNKYANVEMETEVEEKCTNEDNNELKNWIDSMEQRVASIMEEEVGDDSNPRYCPTFAKRLLKQLPTIPVWSSICQANFGFGLMPASNAPVELELKSIKDEILSKDQRVDIALENLITYFDDKLNI
ncbi:PREDICTED: uncharacterized protein LOC108364292 [Rhagoletis zephyria]|uniref:uncharacterized protein LOC108364292 n=1 Tax=Rhagoletis zephyria TaxID=28612 RepID=UPI0008119CA7|nr:PREDICTED: uncharacterized protein LOC108364292 [Rhagoletis zephyria]